jgi:nitrate reductase gamma subunit
MGWNSVLEFARGPLFQVSMTIFVAGMAFRLFRVISLGWSRTKVPSRGSAAGGVVKSFGKGIGIWPFVPWVKDTFKGNAITYMAGGIFHLGLFVVIFLGAAHMLVWKSLLGFGWATLPIPIVDWLAAAAIVGMIALIINRFTNPLLKQLSGAPEAVNWLMVFLPMITGYAMTHHMFFRYEVLYSLHMLVVDAMLVWIPFSRISHFVFYFFSRTIHGMEFGKRAVTP